MVMQKKSVNSEFVLIKGFKISTWNVILTSILIFVVLVNVLIDMKESVRENGFDKANINFGWGCLHFTAY